MGRRNRPPRGTLMGVIYTIFRILLILVGLAIAGFLIWLFVNIGTWLGTGQ